MRFGKEYNSTAVFPKTRYQRFYIVVYRECDFNRMCYTVYTVNSNIFIAVKHYFFYFTECYISTKQGRWLILEHNALQFLSLYWEMLLVHVNPQVVHVNPHIVHVKPQIVHINPQIVHVNPLLVLTCQVRPISPASDEFNNRGISIYKRRLISQQTLLF